MATQFTPKNNRIRLVSGNGAGDAVRMTIPKDALEHMGWKRGDIIEVSVSGKTMVLERK